MGDIYFTQYLRPDGRKFVLQVTRPDEISKLADLLVAAGFVFECEVLTTGEVSFTSSKNQKDREIEIVPNGPEVLKGVDRLVIRTYEHCDEEYTE